MGAAVEAREIEGFGQSGEVGHDIVEIGGIGVGGPVDAESPAGQVEVLADHVAIDRGERVAGPLQVGLDVGHEAVEFRDP